MFSTYFLLLADQPFKHIKEKYFQNPPQTFPNEDKSIQIKPSNNFMKLQKNRGKYSGETKIYEDNLI